MISIKKIIWIFLALAESELQKYGKLQPSNAQ